MNVFVDVDLAQLIQSPGARTAATAWELKSQDTLATNLFFCSNGVVLDLGESPVLSFGLVAKSDVGTFLVFENVFVRLADPVNGVNYQCLAVFNTTQMAAALAVLSPLPCILEIRFQLANGEIIHTLDQSVTIDRTILVEGGTPAATVIAVYPDPAVLEIKANKDQHSGYAALDSAGHLNPTDFDPAVVVLQSQHDAALGFPRLDADILIPAAELPVDGVTTQVVAGKLVALGPALGVLATTTEPFTVPAVDATTPISTPTIGLVAGNFYTISFGAGTYQFQSVTDDTHGVFLNFGGSLNAAPASVIPFGATISWSGPPGVQGAPGTSATSSLTDAETTAGVSLIQSALGVLNRIVAGTGIAFDITTTPGGIIINATAVAGVTALSDAETSTGQTLISSVTGVLMRLVAGTNITFDTTTISGAIIVNGAIGGAGVAALSDAETTVGQTLIQTSAGSLKRIIAGAGIALDALTTAGGVIINSNLVDAETSAGASVIAAAGFLKRIIAGTNITLDISTTTGGIIINAAGAALTDAETTTGLTLISSTAGVLKRLVAGTNISIDAVSTPGAIIINDTGGGSTLSDAETSTGSTLLGSTAGQVKRLVGGSNISLDTTTTPGAVILNGTIGGSGVSALSDAETTLGASLIATTSGSIKRLVAGANIAFDTGTTPGAVIISDTLTGGALTPDLGVECFDDFVSGNAVTTNYFALGWATNLSTSGSVTSQSVVGVSATGKAAGVVDVAGGSTASVSLAQLYLSGNGASVNNFIIPRLGILTCTWRVWVGALHTTSDYTILRIGLYTCAGSSLTPIDGIYFTYNRLTSANWIASTSSASTATNTTGTVAVTAAAWHKLTITTDAAWANISFSVDGVLIATALTANIPANTVMLPIALGASKTLGSTNHTTSADYMYLKYACAR